MSKPKKQSIVVFGAGGHAKVVIDIIRQEAKFEIQAIVDPITTRTELYGYSICCDHADLKPGAFVVAIGDNKVRKTVFETMRTAGWSPVAVSHPSAILAPDVEVGAGTVIMAGAVINPATIIGENCIINTGTTIDHDCQIGSHSHMAPGCNLAGTVTTGEGVFLGIGAKVIPGIKIGQWSVAGAGAVMVRDVLEDTVVVGVPARRMGVKSTAKVWTPRQ
jgi:sugar O-acyltransferase (sialic acid O-acetyltransferase NeuD family)